MVINTSQAVPQMEMTGGSVPGVLRYRNALEVWPNTAGTTAATLDVRNTSGTPTISLTGATGTVAAAALRAPGAGINTSTFAFTHRVDAGSIGGHITVINNTLCNGDPNAILTVTHNWTQDTSVNRYHTQALGVYYTGSQWAIFHEDNSTLMEVGDAFNVIIVKP